MFTINRSNIKETIEYNNGSFQLKDYIGNLNIKGDKVVGIAPKIVYLPQVKTNNMSVKWL